MQSKTSFRTDIFLCLSAANLAFFKQWSDLTLTSAAAPHTDWTYELVSATEATYAGLLLNVLIVATLFFGALRLAARTQRRWAYDVVHALMALTFGAFLNGLRISLGVSKIMGSTFGNFRFVIFAVVAISVVYVLSRYREYSVSIFRSFVMMMFPFCLITFFYAISGALQKTAGTRELAAYRPTRVIPNRFEAKKRVIVNLFDEFDYRVGFLDRPKDLDLPEMDYWRKHSWFANNARPPGPSTAYSIPSFFIGQKLIEPLALVNNRLSYAMRNPDGTTMRRIWREQTNLFHELRASKTKSAVIGWYLPYCRMLRAADYCERFPHYNFFKYPYSDSVATSMKNFFLELAHIRPSRALHHKMTYESVLESSEKILADPSYQFVFIHWPVPHAPWIYDRETKSVTSRNAKTSAGYLDNLALMDETLRRQRELLQKINQWDENSVIVMSDHGWNSSAEYDGHWDARTPFIVKLPHQTESQEFAPAFNTIVMKEMVKELLEDRIQKPQQLSSWVETHAEEKLQGPRS